MKNIKNIAKIFSLVAIVALSTTQLYAQEDAMPQGYFEKLKDAGVYLWGKNMDVAKQATEFTTSLGHRAYDISEKIADRATALASLATEEIKKAYKLGGAEAAKMTAIIGAAPAAILSGKLGYDLATIFNAIQKENLLARVKSGMMLTGFNSAPDVLGNKARLAIWIGGLKPKSLNPTAIAGMSAVAALATTYLVVKLIGYAQEKLKSDNPEEQKEAAALIAEAQDLLQDSQELEASESLKRWARFKEL